MTALNQEIADMIEARWPEARILIVDGQLHHLTPRGRAKIWLGLKGNRLGVHTGVGPTYQVQNFDLSEPTWMARLDELYRKATAAESVAETDRRATNDQGDI